jgi:uncharacterized protein
MGRVVILVLLVLVIAWWLFGRINKARSGVAAQNKRKRAADAQHMVVCAHCGVHIPLADALKDGALHYCGEPHRLLGPRA